MRDPDDVAATPLPSVSRWQKVLFWIGIAMIAAALIGLALRAKQTVAPPPGVDTLSEFVKAMPPPRWLARTYKDGVYLVWCGESMPWPAVPSGPAMYVFDNSGKLVVWSSESGEGGTVDQWMDDTNSSGMITLPEALAEFAPDKR